MIWACPRLPRPPRLRASASPRAARAGAGSRVAGLWCLPTSRASHRAFGAPLHPLTLRGAKVTFFLRHAADAPKLNPKGAARGWSGQRDGEAKPRRLAQITI
jgi:hypothetical protein